MAYADKDFDTCRKGNPNLTKRDTIYIATELKAIFKAIGEWDQKTIELVKDYKWRTGTKADENRRPKQGPTSK